MKKLEDELAEAPEPFETRDEHQRAVLLKGARAGDPEAISLLWSRYRLRLILPERSSARPR